MGLRGARIQNVVNELNGEKVDVILYSDDPAEFVANALSPSEVTSVVVDVANGKADVIVPDKMLSLAIGKEGQNARLAAKLTGWRIDINSVESLAADQTAEHTIDAAAEQMPEMATAQSIEQIEQEVAS